MKTEINTGKIQTYRYMEGKKDNGQLFIDWASTLLMEGHDTPSLRILAGFVPKENSIFEIESYLLKTLEDLNIPVLTEDEAIKTYTFQILTEMVNGEIEKKKALTLITDIIFETEYHLYIHDFYLLYFALDDLKHQTFAPHWDGATRENIDQIILQTANDWLEKHQDYKIG
jgi:hypothetical protein